MEKQRSEKRIYEERGKLWTGAFSREDLRGKQAVDFSEQLTYGC